MTGMSDYDAIVIGAGHNGLTAATVMARGGMRVLCLEKNHFIGGMATTTELDRGYRFELAGSIQFPIPNEIFDDLGFASCPIYEPEVQSASIGASGEPPILLYCDPERLLDHLSDTLGLEAVWAWPRWRHGPRRRPGPSGGWTCASPPKSLDEMWACATNETERQAIRTAMFGSVMDVVDRFLPDRTSTPRSAACWPSWPSTRPTGAPTRPGSALCLAFALASPGDATMSKVRGGIGTMSDHLPGCSSSTAASSGAMSRCPGSSCPRRRVEGVDAGRRRGGDRAGGRVEPRPHRHLHPAARPRCAARGLRPAGRRHRPPGRLLPDPFRARRAARVRRPLRGAQRGRPPPQCDLLRDGRADAARLRGVRPGPGPRRRRRSTCRSRRCATPTWRPPGSTPPAASPSTSRSAHPRRRRRGCATRWPSASWPRSPRWRRTSRT